MSTQRGNVQRTRKAKHQNVFAYKNTMHDSSGKNKQLNQLQFPALCPRCEEKLQWKVKYKKYKPLTQPRKCVKCEQKTVKQAYYIMCIPCAESKEACAKCLAKLSDPSDLEPAAEGPGDDNTEPGTPSQADPGQELDSEEEEEEEEGASNEVGDSGGCSANEGSDAEELRGTDLSNRERASASSHSHSAQDGED